jgi:folate/biopterin transporter
MCGETQPIGAPTADAEDPPHLMGETSPLIDKKAHVRSELTGCWKNVDCISFGLISWLDDLRKVFGHRLLVLLFVVQHMNKGFATAFAGRATPYLYKSYGVPAPQMQIFGGITQLPWALKPIIGLMSDICPIYGYNKSPYIVMTSVIGAWAFFSVGIVPQSTLTVGIFVSCLFIIALQGSTADLLSEAKYAEKMQSNPQHGPAMLTYVWGGLTVGGLAATVLSGPTLHILGPKALYAVAAFPAILMVMTVTFGYMDETQRSPEEIQQARRRYYQQKEACGLCVLMLLGTIALIITTMISRSPLTNAVVAIIVAVVMLVSFSVVLNPVIAKANAFALIQTALGFSTGGASFYFYTDTAAQYPEGPHFSEFFYNSVLGFVGSIISLFGIYLYQKYMSSWKYRHLLIATNVALGFFSMFDVAMFARLNVKYGIPDQWLVIGLSCIEGIIAQWQWMPQVVILSYLCPRGMEATMYALLAGCHNMGNTIASSCGALLLEWLGCSPSGSDHESVQFKNLWIAAAISTVIPFIAVLLLIRLLPDARQNERLVHENADATTGSLWKQWTSQRSD